MKNIRNTTLYRASRFLSEAFDLDDPMNSIDSVEESPVSYRDPDENLDTEEADEPEEIEKTFDVDVGNPVCPCCGARLNIIDTSDEIEDDNEIEAMDPSLEPEENNENEDAFVSLNDIDFGEDGEENIEDNDEEDIEDEEEIEDEEDIEDEDM